MLASIRDLTTRHAAALASVSFLLLALTGAPPAHADHGHWRGHVGIDLGVPFGYPYGYAPYYRYPPYYYPPVVAAPEPPPVYVERGDIEAAPAGPGAPGASQYWYYCAAAHAYYPYVKSCRAGWLTVVPDANAPQP